jgi:pimeloyl-ACP methyl ester carboxylesterase
MKPCRARLTVLSGLAAAICVGAAAGGGPGQAKAVSRYASLDGHRVHYESLGSGPETIVFVHGWTCDLDVWRLQAPVFAATHRVILVDLPGHGGSDKPRISYTMKLFARSIEAVMEDAGVPRAVLVGHSMGVPVIREFYRLEPRRTSALVAVDGSLRGFRPDPAFEEKFLAPFRGPDYRRALEEFADAMVPAGEPALRAELKAIMVKTPQYVVVSAGETMFDPSNGGEDPIAVPLLCVLAKSPFWSPEYEAYVRRIAPGVDYRVVDESGHFVMLEDPAGFNATLQQFLARTGR